MYKRQVTGRVASNLIVVFAGVAFYMALSNFDALRAQLRAWLGILSPFVWGLVTVSYTHLDVYKRQVQRSQDRRSDDP